MGILNATTAKLNQLITWLESVFDSQILYFKGTSLTSPANFDFRMRRVNTKLRLEQWQTDAWVLVTEFGSFATDTVALEGFIKAIFDTVGNLNYNIWSESATPNGQRYGDTRRMTFIGAIDANGLRLIYPGTEATFSVESVDTTNLTGTSFTKTFTYNGANMLIDEADLNMYSSTKARLTIRDTGDTSIDPLGRIVYQTMNDADYLDTGGVQLEDKDDESTTGEITVNLRNPGFLIQGRTYQGVIETTASGFKGSTSFPFVNLRGNLIVEEIVATRDWISNNIVSVLEGLPDDNKLSFRNGLKDLPVLKGYDAADIYRRRDILQHIVNGITHYFLARQDIQADQGAPTDITSSENAWIPIGLQFYRGDHNTEQKYYYGQMVRTGTSGNYRHWILVTNSVLQGHTAPSDSNNDWEEIFKDIPQAERGKLHTGFFSSGGQINPTLNHAGNFFEFTGNTPGDLNAGVFLPASASDDDLFKFFTIQNRGTVQQNVRGSSAPGHTFNLLGGTLPYIIDVGASVTLEIIARTATSTTYALSNIDVVGGANGTSESSVLTAATLTRDDHFTASGDNARLNHTYSLESTAADKSFTIGPYADFNLMSPRSGVFNVSNPHDTNWLKVVNSNGNFKGMATDTLWLAPGELKKFILVRSGDDYFIYPVGRVAYNFEAESGLLVPNNWTLSTIYGLPSDLIKLKEGGTNQIEFKIPGVITGLTVDLMWNFNGTAAADFASLLVRTPSINLRKNGTASLAGHDSSVMNLAGAKVGYHQEFGPMTIAADDYLDVTGTDLTDILGTTLTLRGEYVLKAY